MKKIKYIKGTAIGKCEFVKEIAPHISPSRSNRRAIFKCRCGEEFKAVIRSVVTENTKSCGCYGTLSRKLRFTTHGMRSSKYYSQWCSMKTRCFNKNRSDYKYYGGRGITVSDEFKNDFKAWFDYVSSLNNFGCEGRTIDRKDPDGNYERGNIRWATKREQCLNTSKNKRKYINQKQD